MVALDSEQLLEDVGRRIANMRVDRKLTQAELAARAEVSIKYLQRVEAGQENLTLRSIAKFANLFGVGIVSFFTGPVDERPSRGRPPAQRD